MEQVSEWWEEWDVLVCGGVLVVGESFGIYLPRPRRGGRRPQMGSAATQRYPHYSSFSTFR